MSIGTKIIPNTLEVFVINTLKSNNLTFFIHLVKDNQKFKLVLYDLPQINAKMINEKFKTVFNIEPLSICLNLTKMKFQSVK